MLEQIENDSEFESTQCAPNFDDYINFPSPGSENSSSALAHLTSANRQLGLIAASSSDQQATTETSAPTPRETNPPARFEPPAASLLTHLQSDLVRIQLARTPDLHDEGTSRSNRQLASALARLASGSSDAKSAERATDRIGSMWLNVADRVATHQVLLDAYRVHGDKYGYLQRAILALAIRDEWYMNGQSAADRRQEMLAATTSTFDAVSQRLEKEIKDLPATDPQRQEKLRIYFQALNLSRAATTWAQPSSLRTGRVDVISNEFIAALPRISNAATATCGWEHLDLDRISGASTCVRQTYKVQSCPAISPMPALKAPSYAMLC